MIRRGRLVVLSGPSGSGKSTVVDRLMADPPVPLEISSSVTTRPPRPDDRHAKRYVYVSAEEFEAARRRGELLEWARVSGHCYGTPRQPVEQALAEGRWVLLEIDVQGGLAIKQMYPDCIMIFLRAPSLDVYEQRLRRRGTNTEQEIQQRLAAAGRELAAASQYQFHVVNDRLDQTAAELRCLLARLQAEASRPGQTQDLPPP